MTVTMLEAALMILGAALLWIEPKPPTERMPWE